jgi:hypothetical protein
MVLSGRGLPVPLPRRQVMKVKGYERALTRTADSAVGARPAPNPRVILKTVFVRLQFSLLSQSSVVAVGACVCDFSGRAAGWAAPSRYGQVRTR